MQILSEVIQSASDAGKILIRDALNEEIDNAVHVVATSEKMMRNISTINRCFLVRMEEIVEESLWKKIEEYREKHFMQIFMISFMTFIENEYDDIVNKCKNDYLFYSKQKYSFQETEGKSGNRITNTIAVQFVIKKLIIYYFQGMKIDMKLIERVNENLDFVINGCFVNLQHEINGILQKNRTMDLLPTLTDIITSEYSCVLAKSEDKYKAKYNKKGKPYMGICVHPGYVSFLPKYMCELIAQRKEVEAVSERKLGKELKDFSLVHIDAEGKMSTRWGTEKRMYHVRVRDLIELTIPEELHYDYKDVIQKFEEV